MILAHIAYTGRREDCVVRNVSDTGAKLELKTPVAKIPNSFELLVAEHHPQACRVVWRSLREVGVQFM